MSEAALVINHTNFKQNRSAYGFTLRDIADKAGVSVSTVDNYEKFDSSYIRTRNRDENAKRIERALSELIDEQIVRVFPNSQSKEEKVVEYSANNLKSAFDREYVGEKIKNYCSANGMCVSEFCDMCGITTSSFAASTLKDHKYLYPRTISKIINATGWTMDMFKQELDVPFSECEKPVVKEAKAVKEEPLPKGETRDHKYIFENGKYFEVYTEVIVREVKNELTKEEFLSKLY